MTFAVKVFAGAALMIAPAVAQEISVPPVTTASPGGYANPLKLDTDRYERERRAKSKPPRAAASPAAGCSLDAMPLADRRTMAKEYARRDKADGRTSADNWIREEGRRFRQKLVAQGVCPE